MRSLKNRGACGTIFEVRTCVRRTGKYIATQSLVLTKLRLVSTHTIYTRNNVGQKCEGICGLWVLNEILKKSYPENLKKIVGAV